MVQYFEGRQDPTFEPGKTSIPLNLSPWGWMEIDEAVDSLLSTMLSMGKKVARFEAAWTQYVGARHCTMVNSGSSANLLALNALTEPSLAGGPRIRSGDEVLVPAVTWSTTVFPVVQVGATARLVDVGADDYNLDPEQVRKAITKKTKAIMPVHLLGNPARMKELMEIAEDHHLAVIEDCCEAHGAEEGGKRVGSFGTLSAFSFFFSHHISTIEGGTIHTNDESLHNVVRSLRAHGWVRERADREDLVKQNPDIDPRFLFVSSGYNLRPTEIQGAFGVHQIPKLEAFIDHRRKHARVLQKAFAPFKDVLRVHSERRGTRHVWFGFPFEVAPDAPFTREQIVKWMEQHRIETRPIMGGNLVEQPAFRHVPHKAGNLSVAPQIHRRSFFMGNHQGIGKQQQEFIIDTVSDFIERKRWRSL